MFVPTIIVIMLSVVVIATGLADMPHAIRLSHDRKLLLKSLRRRTGRTMGTVIGGSALSYGERLTCPLVRFEVDGEECLATGPAIDLVLRGNKKEINGDILFLTDTEFAYTNSHSREFARLVDAIRESERNGKELRNRWDLAYQDSVLSELYPVGDKVAVAYDEAYPQSNNMVLMPNGNDQTLIAGRSVRMAWGRALMAVLSGCLLLALSLAFLTGGLVIA